MEKNYEKITRNTINIAIKKAKELDIKKIVVASCSGKTTKLLIGCGIELINVTHQFGSDILKEKEYLMKPKVRDELIYKGVKILTATHLLGGIDRALRIRFGGIYPSEIIATTFRMFGQGIKVCIEISVMATDAGLLSQGENIIAIAGTGKGANTAIVICPYHSQNFFKTKIREIICKPYEF